MIDEIIIKCIFFLSTSLLFLYVLGLIKLNSGLNNLDYKLKKHLPKVSIVVSMHNEENNAIQCIKSLLMQNYPKESLEIIIVDDRSKDKTLEIIKNYSIRYKQIKSISIKQLNPDFAPKKYAIDKAIHQASGDIILLTDADGRPGPLWVHSIISYFADNVGMVIGYAPYNTNNLFKSLVYKLLALDYLSLAAIAGATCGLGFPATCVGTNMAYRKDVYKKLGGFGKYKKYHSGDDDLFLQRVRDETDYKIRYTTLKESQVYNDPPNNWKKFYSQRIRYASKGFYYPLKMTLVLIALFLFNLLLILNPFLLYSNKYLLSISTVALVVKILFDYFFMKNAAKILHDARNLFLIPLASILHIPYVIYFGLMGQFQNYKWAGYEQKK